MGLGRVKKDELDGGEHAEKLTKIVATSPKLTLSQGIRIYIKPGENKRVYAGRAGMAQYIDSLEGEGRSYVRYEAQVVWVPVESVPVVEPHEYVPPTEFVLATLGEKVPEGRFPPCVKCGRKKIKELHKKRYWEKRTT